MNVRLIIEGCLKGQERSEKRLFELHYGFVKSICQRYAQNPFEADEMLNDTFFKVFRFLDRYDTSLPFTPWLHRVCINACLEHNRKYFQKLSMEPLEFNSSALESEMDWNIDDWDDSELLGLIQRLSPGYRAVFNLYVMEEYKHHEIAEMLDISVGASKSNLNRAKNQLLSLIKSHKGGQLFSKYK